MRPAACCPFGTNCHAQWSVAHRLLPSRPSEQAYQPAGHPARSHFKNESDFVPQSGYFSVNVPGAHIISLHSYVSWPTLQLAALGC